MHEVNHGLHYIGIRSRQQAVSAVENMAGASTYAVHNVARFFQRDVAAGEKRDRIEIALDRFVFADDVPRGVDRQTPIDRDAIAAGLRNERQQCGVAGREVNDRYARIAHLRDQSLRVWQHVRLVILR